MPGLLRFLVWFTSMLLSENLGLLCGPRAIPGHAARDKAPQILHAGRSPARAGSVWSNQYLIEFRWWDSYHGRESEVYLLEKSADRPVRALQLGSDTFSVYRILHGSEIRGYSSLLICCEKNDLRYEQLFIPGKFPYLDSLEGYYDTLLSQNYTPHDKLILKKSGLRVAMEIPGAEQMTAFIYKAEVAYCTCLPAFSNLIHPFQDTVAVVSSITFHRGLSAQEKMIFKEQLPQIMSNPVISGFFDTF